MFAVIADRCIGSTVIDDITRAVQGYALHGILRANRLLHIIWNVILPQMREPSEDKFVALVA